MVPSYNSLFYLVTFVASENWRQSPPSWREALKIHNRERRSKDDCTKHRKRRGGYCYTQHGTLYTI